MAAKVTYTFKVSKGNKADTLKFLNELQELPQHKWIPIKEMSESNRATMTPRQAGWLESRVSKNGAAIEFNAVAVKS